MTLFMQQEDAYDERIDVQECKSDLFWRLTGITSVPRVVVDKEPRIHILLLVLNSLRFMINQSLVYQVFLLVLESTCWIFNQ